MSTIEIVNTYGVIYVAVIASLVVIAGLLWVVAEYLVYYRYRELRVKRIATVAFIVAVGAFVVGLLWLLWSYGFEMLG